MKRAQSRSRTTPQLPPRTVEDDPVTLPAPEPEGPTRRSILRAGALGATALVVAQGGLTPTIVDADDLTPSLTEGPYFKPNSPLRTNLRTAEVVGVFLDLGGLVTDVNNRPIANALLEFWQADMNGQYSTATNADPATLAGYELRGHQYTAADGSYQVQTIIPGHYAGRTLHIHVKVQAPNAAILTTQLFFPAATQAYNLNIAALNAQDGIIHPLCIMVLEDVAAAAGFPYYRGGFHFVTPTTTAGTGTGTGTRPANPNRPSSPARRVPARRRSAR